MKRLPLYIIASILLGILTGLLFPPNPFASTIATVFLRLLKMIVIPIILTSLVTGVVSIFDIRKLGQMGIVTLSYYLVTSSLAIGTGLIVVNLIHPGHHSSLELTSADSMRLEEMGIGDIFLRLIPQNPVESMAQGQVLPVIFFAVFLGIVMLSFKREEVSGLVTLFEQGFKVTMRMTTWILMTAPIGIWALVSDVFSNTGLSVVVPLSWYFVTVLLALLIHALITLPTICWLIGKRSPAAYFKDLFPALATAFSTASSSATLPLTMECVEKRAGISNRVTSFVLPLGATINMDGTALYEAVAAIFIAEVYGFSLSLTQQLTVFLTALLASIGAAGIPMAGLVMMAVVLKSVGLPLEGVALIVGVDRFLDMIRTSTNVWSDSVGCSVLARITGDAKPR